MKQPKPFFRRFTKSWYVQIGRRQINLGRDKKLAWEKYHELMAKQDCVAEQLATVAQLFDTYLEWCLTRRSQGTYRNNRLYLRSFIKCVGTRLAIAKLRPHHVTKWMDDHPDWSDTTRNDAISIAQRPFNWAVRQGRLDRNPIACLEDKPPRQRREVVYTPDQWQQVMARIRDEQFRNLMAFLWETGCRPQEARLLEARHVDLRNGVAVFPPSEAKGKKHPRVLFLNDTALELVRPLCTANPTGSVFLNTRGRPWTKDAVKCRLNRLKKKVGMPVLCAYGIRHSFATEGLKNGVDSISLAALMGHSDVSMIARTYQHLARHPDFLREQAGKAKGA
ncbi:MAG: site-specific integrase [Planctomycetaceae bacterium]